MLVRHNSVPFHDLILPDTVYKYRRWNNEEHKRLLTHAELMFELPFNMDVGTELKYKITPLKGQQLLAFYQDKVKRLPQNLNKAERFKKAFAEFRISDFKDFSKVQKAVEELVKEMNDNFGALCLGGSNNNNYLWDHYGSSGHGFCVGIDPRRVVTDMSFFGGTMQYYPPGEEPTMRFPSINPQTYSDDLLNVILSLPECLEAEGEYRIAKLNSGPISVSKEAIVEVVIGYAMGSDQEIELVNIVSEILPHALILKSELNSENGNINVRRLN